MKLVIWCALCMLWFLLPGCEEDKGNPTSSSYRVPSTLVGAWDNVAVSSGTDAITLHSDKRFTWTINDNDGLNIDMDGTVAVNEGNGAIEFDGYYVRTYDPDQGSSTRSEGPFTSVYEYQVNENTLLLRQGGVITAYERRTF